LLGDPLLRIVRKPVRELKSRVAPLAKAAATGGSSLSEKAASLGSIVGMLGREWKSQRQGGSDPVERQRQRLPISDAERAELEAEVEAEVQAAVAAALCSQEGRG
jgi:hypothetical protein